MEVPHIIIQMTIRFMISLSLITSDYEAHGIDTEGNQVTFVVDTEGCKSCQSDDGIF